VWYVGKTRRLRPVLALLPWLWPSGLAAQLTFQRAVELAAQHFAVLSLDSSDPDKTYETCAEARSFDILQIAANSGLFDSLDFSATLQGAPPSLFDRMSQELFVKSVRNSLTRAAEPRSQTPLLRREDRRERVLLCTAVDYAELEKLNSQIEVVHRQDVAATRLLNIEAQRVVTEFDSPEMLTRAKLLAARTRMWAAGLEGSARQLRKRLGDLTGLPEEEIDPVADSMPVLQESEATVDWLEAKIKQQAAARDVAQLEYVLARTNKMKTKGKAVMAKASVGDLEAAFVIEFEKLNALLEMNFELQKTQLEALKASGNLEKWARRGDDDWAAKSRLSTAVVAGPTAFAATIPQISGAATLAPKPTVKSIMITPAKSSILAGQSQQFSAIAIYSDGKAKDATSEATWRCSSNWGAMVSTSGLFTALATGQVTISATVGGVSRSQRIAITVDDWTPLNP
jgi:Big-like domain-containing protein